MFAATLSYHLAARLLRMALAMFALSLLLIVVIDYVETARRAYQDDSFDPARLALMAALRAPAVAEELLPFVMLFAATAAFVVANRRLETVVARAAGLSAWQFLVPAALVAVALGVFATAAYSPAAGWLKERSGALGAALGGRPGEDGGDFTPAWYRQSGRDGEAILRAARTLDDGRLLLGVTAFVFERDGGFRERIDAPSARLSRGEWQFERPTVTTLSAEPQRPARYTLHSYLSPAEAQRALGNIDTIPVWALRELISLADSAGIGAATFRLRFHTLLAQPVLFLAMVMIAAAITLRFARTVNLTRTAVAAMAAGFALYVVSKLAHDLAAGGLVPPAMGAWFPAIAATLASATALLFREDG